MAIETPEGLNNASAVTAREVTDDEVAFYEEHGWVQLEELITPELAAELLAAGKKLKDLAQTAPYTTGPEETPAGTKYTQETEEWRANWTDLRTGAQAFQAWMIRTEPFYSLTFGKTLGRAAQRLMNRASLTDKEVGVRYRENLIWCKAPIGPGSGDGTGFHQDNFAIPVDRVGTLEFWIALEEVTPEQGAIRFLDKSHRAGPLGNGPSYLLKQYPRLAEKYPFSPPLHFKPGDATVHHHLTIHGAPENSSLKPRWSYLCGYMPEDGIFDAKKIESLYKVSEPYEERFPLIFP